MKHFEVKTGKNKGFYIVAPLEKVNFRDQAYSEQYRRLAQTYGMLVAEYNAGFYKYHKVNPETEVIWTHTNYTSHEFNRKVWQELLKDLKNA